jgi:hypothetical protein
MKKNILGLLCALGALTFGAAAHAIPITLDFEAEAIGARANGFSLSGVSFSDTVGAEMGIFQVPEGLGARSLAVGNDQDGSALEMLFAFEADLLSLSFGNDDPSNTNAGDLAVLTLFAGLNQVGQVTQALNRDDLMNQTISFGSIGGTVLFNRALFAFTNATLSTFTGGGATNVGASEVVDNISLNSVRDVIAVSEPGTLVLLLATLVALRMVGRRRAMART